MADEIVPSRAAKRALRVAMFTSSYDKARRSYGVASALLLGWALIGIELERRPLANVNVSLETPRAAPYVFVALVVYFAFRFTIEWYQADPNRRAARVSLIDYAVGHAIGVGSIAVFVGQALWRVQFFDYPLALIAAIAVAYAVGYEFVRRYGLPGEGTPGANDSYWDMADGLSALAAVALLILSARSDSRIAFIVGPIVAFGQYAVVHLMRHRHHERDENPKITLADIVAARMGPTGRGSVDDRARPIGATTARNPDDAPT